MARRLRILLAGLGGIGQRHARNLRMLLGDEVELLAYRAIRSSPLLTAKMEVDGRQDVESRFQLRVFHELAEALNEKPDAVVIANPTSMHLSVARAAAEAGCHLFIEKPISHSLEGLSEFLELVARKELVSFVGYQWRFHPLFEEVKQALRETTVGRIISVLAEFGEYLPGWHPYEDYRQSYAARRELGGGVLLTQIHDFDYLGWLFGWPKRVFCTGGRLSSLEIDVEDTANTSMECEYEGGGVPIHLHQDYVQRRSRRRCRIIGENGTILIDLIRARFSILDEGGAETRARSYDDLERNDIFVAEMKHFLDCIAGRSRSLVPAMEGAKSLRVALAARQSLHTGLAIKL